MNHKGAEKSGVDYIATWLETFGYRQFEVHTDGESSSIACMRAAVSKYAAAFPEDEKEEIVIKHREAPTDSHASLGSGEVSNQIVEGLWRTMRVELEETLEAEADVGIVELGSSVRGLLLQPFPADERRSPHPV